MEVYHILWDGMKEIYIYIYINILFWKLILDCVDGVFRSSSSCSFYFFY
jgi:hypothetical protein